MRGKECADYIRQREIERKKLAKTLIMTEEEKIMQEIDAEEKQAEYIELKNKRKFED
jgi:hypothetical protein